VPSPVAHGLVGLTVHVLSARERDELFDPWRAAVTVGAALIPDADLLLRFVDGRNHHGNEMHSIGFAIVAAVAGAALFRLLRWKKPLATALAVFLAWASHVVLDYLNVDTHPPIGIMALWPFSNGYYKSPIPIFLDIGRTLDWTAVQHNSLAVAWECVVLIPLLLLAWRHRVRHLGRGAWRVGSKASP
jgi:membrane-bound metal-dependent hydrolase YbcI (DUF457 family)